jgi:hypothetical protein
MPAIAKNTGFRDVEVTIIEMEDGYAVFEPSVQCMYDFDAHYMNELPFFYQIQPSEAMPYILIK